MRSIRADSFCGTLEIESLHGINVTRGSMIKSIRGGISVRWPRNVAKDISKCTLLEDQSFSCSEHNHQDKKAK